MTRLRLIAAARTARPFLASPCRNGRPLALAATAAGANSTSAPAPMPAPIRFYSAEARKNWKQKLEAFSKQDKTPLYDFHLAHGGKMVIFGGHHMPVQYTGLSLAESHHFTRNHASLFDVSHMVQHRFTGPKAASFLETVTPSSVSDMEINSSKLSTFLWPKTGGIVDDTMITRLGENEYAVVSNAGTREKIFKYLTEQTADLQKPESNDFWWEVLEGYGLVALQGPQAAEVLQEVIDPADGLNLEQLYFGNTGFAKLRYKVNGEWKTTSEKAMISRGGYTGEDGFEISFKSTNGEAQPLAETLLEVAGPERLQLAGLGARDSLRLEAGMCLYGHDIDDTTTPVEGSLSWIIPKERRTKGGFHGAEVITKQLVPKSKGGSGIERRRVGFLIAGAPAREGAEIFTKDGEKVGVITSGSPSPTLGKNIAMGYVKEGQHKSGTELDVVVRGKKRAATVAKMPLVPSKYFKGPTPAPA
ncbi:putative aminomethyltransferase [Colletotrichum siamense]|uniref:Aminomethyltransferase n=1 Tax=Colletotrichum siamense TaxID=690259 RepID=A0A9P5EDI9_COLSI|nr:putative aminomethyltransferase [Colletotrichum siamense]KAI8156878.1 putative aminomethyltransferase [Colletotrichum sp. SAR 10_65]KAI8172325.1 putative aminomethyltransferase [Colletotrichum sp. SAR 10_75]KAI8195190.1 putative aminomethyltransferase [Colletotrichum sp. SAR 10_76]KAI8215952.1 putative aminomethyltransferase [Colletotrichum sp. SAR 10_86]KAI8248548.1 putative aminomethyltransferase [Colletotrichum sp. SAR11_239]KAJ4994817.1 putative aminomethyltransferase [Colletotrichum s